MGWGKGKTEKDKEAGWGIPTEMAGAIMMKKKRLPESKEG